MNWNYQRMLLSTFQSTNLRNLLQTTWGLSRKEVHFLRINRAVLINGHYQSMNTIVRSGDSINLKFASPDFSTPIPSFLPDSAANLEILFETDDLLIANKASGVKTHANQPNEVGSLMNHLAAYLNNTSAHPYNVHRLDQQTSGAILVVKNPVLIPIYNRFIKNKVVHRTYLAVVQGKFSKLKGQISLPIGKTSFDKRQRVVNGTDAVPAKTSYRVLQMSAHYSLVEIQLQTGRTHQIRVHFASLGHPVVGDPLYNPEYRTGQRLALHSWKISFPLPFSTETKTITAPIPERLQIKNFN
ncbi:RluA family pseudouridine synthase [Pediococcus ethanolidurans]|uniref:RluA family pseudouridine synthase n=1 Tax=Pediococcus ethanolidurans TaxID=319653 RepID=UPI001C1E90AA|nr:RluA family pseudouridine synthase [Pediococcus ethanolidurans]MBU7564247.1 RluA family pseudouridine synthase [Pediococcus ethanolidurans]MCV3328038.1 RluA family pseudouridine synthase [Pediococcus ethanolidurans]MCV3554374.1 RluA family pseudouridine synthase [Pediococcus ethanolidurans]